MESKRRAKRKTMPVSSEESIIEPFDDEPMEEANEAESKEKADDVLQGLSTMTEEEMAQHLKLCMKLSVENKINMKNAFGLHLIEIMQKIVKKSERADIQQASLSLQASSKIYAGRVEALYQDTFRFHGHLQSIVSGGKKEKKNAKNMDMDDEIRDDVDDDEENSEKGRMKPQKSKCKSFLKPEEALRIESEISALSTGEPHGNFHIINAAFSTSRLAPKLLSSLQLVNDSGMLRCAIPEPCFKPKASLNNTLYVISPKLEGILDKLRNFNASQSEFQALLASTENSFAPNISTPKPNAAPSMLFSDEEIFDAPCNDSVVAAPSDGADLIESAIEKFDVLNITADTFVNDISAAVTNKGIDHNLLPPNSALKKMLDKSKRSTIKPSVGRTTKRKPKEPFFTGRSADDIRHLFVKGRSTLISQKVLSEWSVDDTTNIDLGYEFLEELENKYEEDLEDNFKQRKDVDQILDIIKQNDLQYHFKHYFNKESQMWKVSRRRLRFDLSFPGGTPIGNQTENKRLGSIAPNDPEVLALSFQNLSLHDSMHETPVPDYDDNVSDHGVPLTESDEPQFLVPPEAFETDIEEMMVKPPELVRPTSVKFDKRPVNLNTEKIKDLMWKIISRRLELKVDSTEDFATSVLFSDVYEELKILLEKEISEFISMQFAFVVLLILANQKTLLIENMEENTDLRIKQDIAEIDISESA